MSAQPRNDAGKHAVDVEALDDVEASKPGPDKGCYCWLVAIAGSWLLAVMIGTTRTSGVLFVHFVSELHVNRDQASWPPTAVFLTMCATSPVAAILSKHFSIRSLCCVGSVLSGSAIFACYFVSDIILITLLLGVLCGIAQSLLFNLSIVAVNQYFQRHRSTANGIQQAGASFGGAVLPPTAEFIVEKFSLHGAFLFLGGVATSTLGASLLLKKPRWLQDEKPIKFGKISHSEIPKSNNVTLQSYKFTSSDNNPVESKENNANNISSAPSQICDSLPTNDNVKVIDSNTKKPLEDQVETVNLLQKFPPKYNGLTSERLDNKTASCKDVPVPLETSNSNTVNHQSKKESEKQRTVSEPEESAFKSTCKQHLKDIISVIKLPMFWVSCQSQMVYFFVFNVYNQSIADHSKDRGLGLQEATYIMSICSAADLFGRLSTGGVCKFIRGKNLVFLSAFAMGIACALTPLAFQFATIFTASGLFGFMSGLLRTVTVIQFIEYLGMEKFHLALGISQFTCGLPHLFRPTLIGYFRDSVGSYNGLFYLNGGVALASACAWLLEPLYFRRKSEASQNDSKT